MFLKYFSLKSKKLFADGALGASTAALSLNYKGIDSRFHPNLAQTDPILRLISV